MIDNLKVVSGNIFWTFNDKDIHLKLENAFFASKIEDERMIKIEAGKNFVASTVVYYSFNGEMLFKYDLNYGIVEWIFQGIKKYITMKNIEGVCFLPQKQRILILCNEAEKQVILGYTMEGKSLFKVSSPVDFKMCYFVKKQDEVMVVCDGNNNYTDAYGRFQYNFCLNTDTGILRKEGLAY